MKTNAIQAMVFSLFSGNLIAQNYQPISSDLSAERHFERQGVSCSLKLDSINQDTLYTHSMDNELLVSQENCDGFQWKGVYFSAHAFGGDYIINDQNESALYSNVKGEVIYLEFGAITGESWDMFWFPNSERIVATVVFPLIKPSKSQANENTLANTNTSDNTNVFIITQFSL